MKGNAFEHHPCALEDNPMSNQLEKNLAHAFAEESKGAVRNKAYVLKAEKDGYPELACLFKAVSNAKSVHARRFLNLMRGKIGTTEENLEAALKNEISAAQVVYPAMVEEAKGAAKAVKKAFMQSRKTDEEYKDLLKKFMQEKDKQGDRVYYVCQICGHIHVGFIPDNCPVCKAVPGRFKKVS